ncbi:UNVERIFIED_CONTAM: hypothetical protein FKN15_041052 [Acipenser sinensis]
MRPTGNCIKAGRYDASFPWEAYKSVVCIATWANSLCPVEKAGQLVAALEGKALQVLLDLNLVSQNDIKALSTALDDEEDDIIAMPHTPPSPVQRRLRAKPCKYCWTSTWTMVDLVDTGSTISIVWPGVLPTSHSGQQSEWMPTSPSPYRHWPGHPHVWAPLLGGPALHRVQHEFWLADIQDCCILGLDLLAEVGATLDLAKKTLQIGQCCLRLDTGQEYEGGDSPHRGYTNASAEEEHCPPDADRQIPVPPRNSWQR